MYNTKVVTGKVRFSFCHIWEPQQSNDGGDPKYNVTLLIPKSDTATLQKMTQAIKDARAKYCEKNGAQSLPAQPKHTLRDGDGVRDNGEPFGEECKGCYVITVSSKQKPVIVDAFKNEITDPNEVYSGCYGRAAINFFGYNTKGKKGISAGLLSIQKLCDGEPFGLMGSADDFDDDYVDPSAGESYGFL